MVEVTLGGVEKNISEQFKVDAILKVKPIKKIYRFSQVGSASCFRLSIPAEVRDELKIDANTHYLTFYSAKRRLVVFLFFQFEELFQQFDFIIGGEEEEDEDGESEDFRGNLAQTLLYKLEVIGQLSNSYRRVWVSRDNKKHAVKYGVTIPPDVRKALGIDASTIFFLMYTPEARLMILELRRIGTKNIPEKKMVPPKEVEEKLKMGNFAKELHAGKELSLF